MTTAQRINQDSGNVEYYTPVLITEAARRAMGGIDLDPFSSEAANRFTNAARIFTAEQDGFAHEWNAETLWMNHPFSRAYNARAIAKLIAEYEAGRTKQACAITFAATSEKWFQPLARFPQCFLSPRTNYFLPDGSIKRGVTKGSVVTYLGSRLDAFAEAFRGMGAIKVNLTATIPQWRATASNPIPTR